MAGFIKSIQQSVYLKLMFVFYGLTLLMLGSHLVRYSTTDGVYRISTKMMVTTDLNLKPQKEYLQNKHTQTQKIGEVFNEVKIENVCPENKFPSERLKPETWQRVGPDSSALVFSAYREAKAPNVIKIMGITVRRVKEHFCQLWYKNSSQPNHYQMTTTKAAFSMLHSSPLKYIACAIKCSIPPGSTPFAVSLVQTSNCAQADNVVPITHVPEAKYTNNFTVCLSPLNFRYGRAYELVEWIELNRILGADKFMVYNFSSAVNIVSVLDYYRRQGVVELIQWDLPVGVDQWPPKKGIEVHYFAQTSAFNDCLTRSRGTSEYIVILDLDEFIIPHGEKTFTWNDVIGQMPHAGAYMFRNSFFRKEWTQNFAFTEREQAEKYMLVSLLQIGRETKVWAPKQRTKYIARTSAIDVAVTHDLTPTSIVKVVDPNLGLLHHYRNWLNYNERIANVTDKTVVQKYSKLLVERVTEVWSNLPNVVMDIPIE